MWDPAGSSTRIRMIDMMRLLFAVLASMVVDRSAVPLSGTACIQQAALPFWY